KLFTGGGPHLKAPWSHDVSADHQEAQWRLKQGLSFPPPSAVQNEIRFDYRWLDELILRCLDAEPQRRFAHAGELLQAIEMCEIGQELPPLSDVGESSRPSPHLPPFSPSPFLPSKDAEP